MIDVVCTDCRYYVPLNEPETLKVGECGVEDIKVSLVYSVVNKASPCDGFEKIYNSVRFIKEEK